MIKGRLETHSLKRHGRHVPHCTDEILNSCSDRKRLPHADDARCLCKTCRSARSALRLEERDEVSWLLVLLDASEHHLRPGRSACLALRLKEGDEVSSLLILLDASEHHLRPWDVLLGVDQVFEHMLVRPHDPRVLVGLGVCETLASA